ncbi:ComEA family DNA-binding protein [Polaribacter uvawellassae]|uniref:ComEA family DNA-binding protein n=1 Tax=Polaribacter uvawellassae TaxID=3133495 RepID=UPI00321BBDB5
MFKKRPHFWYNKSQRNGVFFLLLIIVILQIAISLVNFSSNNKDFNIKESIALNAKIDSLKKNEIENRKPKIYPFNPNYITDYKGAQLGMSIKEIDRLLAFRKTNKFINSVSQFQKITQVSDSLLDEISPYFKFPEWIVKQNQQKNVKSSTLKLKDSKSKRTTTDLNFATAKDFQTINGVDKYVAQRIVKYRERLSGFSDENQLKEVWKLDISTVQRILNVFKVIDEPIINKINVNTATFKQVLSNPYIDYELCKKIFEFRDEVAELQSIEELKNIEGFPLDKYDRIILYLEAK